MRYFEQRDVVRSRHILNTVTAREGLGLAQPQAGIKPQDTKEAIAAGKAVSA